MEQENKYDIVFPAIGIDGWSFTFSIRDEQDLVLCTRRGIRKGFYKNLIVLDSRSQLFIIKNISIIGYAPWRYWLSMFDIGVRVKLEMTEPEIISLDKFKEMIIDRMKNKRDLWESGDPLGIYINPIRKSATAADITQYFCELYYRKY